MRRAVAVVKVNYRVSRVRVHRPWVTEPGVWIQYDFGDGPMIDGVETTLFVAWLSWSRFRVVLAIRGKTSPSVMAALDVTMRRIGGAPTYVLTDNEKTVTVEYVAWMAVRKPAMVAFARHSVTIYAYVPVDPASKDGSESSVKVAKADLVLEEINLLKAYELFADLEDACEVFCAQVNAREHSATRRAPDTMLAEKRFRLHPVPADPHTVAFGFTRTVSAKTPMVTCDSGQYSVPHLVLGETVRARVHGRGADEQVVIVHVGPTGTLEVARHARATPGSPRNMGAHLLPHLREHSAGSRWPGPCPRPRSCPSVTARGCGWPRAARRAPPRCA